MLDKLIQGIRKVCKNFTEHRYKNAQIDLSDFVMRAFAMFHLKDPSVNHYRLNYKERESNLKRIYKIEKLYSDSAMREAIDDIAPAMSLLAVP